MVLALSHLHGDAFAVAREGSMGVRALVNALAVQPHRDRTLSSDRQFGGARTLARHSPGNECYPRSRNPRRPDDRVQVRDLVPWRVRLPAHIRNVRAERLTFLRLERCRIGAVHVIGRECTSNEPLLVKALRSARPQIAARGFDLHRIEPPSVSALERADPKQE